MTKENSESNKKLNEDLFRAVLNGKADEVKSLIDAGTDVNAKDDSGCQY